MEALAPLYAIYVDATFRQWCYILGCFFSPSSADNARKDIETAWSDWRRKDSRNECNNPIVCVSARTCLDLFLQTKPFPTGSEILIGGINIPNIPLILRRHGLIPVPVDLQLDKINIDLERAEKSVTERTKGILVAHLYGSRNDMRPVCDFATKHHLMLIEDCAEAFCGKQYTGEPRADLSFFSFGLIKTNTSFSGAIGFVKDQERYCKMKEIQQGYDSQRRVQYLCRVLVGLLVLLLQWRPVVFVCFQLRRLFNVDYKEYVVPILRGYDSRGGLQQFRLKPSAPLLRAMRYRLISWDEAEYMSDMKKLIRFTQQLCSSGLRVPGIHATSRGFWLYPVYAPSGVTPQEMCAALWQLGVDATVQSTQLDLVEPPTTGPYHKLQRAPEFMQSAVYLPVHRGATPAELERIVMSIQVFLKATKNINTKH